MKLALFALAFFLPACSTIPLAPLAVPEKSLAARFDLRKETGWQEWALCAFYLRTPSVVLDCDETKRTRQEKNDIKEFFKILQDFSGKPFRGFREKLTGLPFIQETQEKNIVDAMEKKPSSSPGRVAYRIHDCWFVVYSKDEKGNYTVDDNKAVVTSLTIFCDPEN